MTDTNNAEAGFVSVNDGKANIGIDWQAKPELSLQIGRTGEKAKFQGRLVNIDLRTLPAASIAFALEYGLKQYLADGTAGSEDQTGYDVGLDQRIAKLKEGDFSRKAGTSGPRQTTPEGLAKKLAADAIRLKLSAAGHKADAKAINEAAAKMVEAQPVWLERAKKELAETAKMSAGLDDIMADIMGLTDGEEVEA